MSNTWAWVYGDECDFLWEHFGMPDRNSNDRIKVKLVDFEEEKEDENYSMVTNLSCPHCECIVDVYYPNEKENE